MEDSMQQKTCLTPLVLLFPLLLSCSLFSTAASSTPLPIADEDTVPSTAESEPPESFRGVPVMPGAQPRDAVQVGTAFTCFIQATVQEVKDYYLRELPLAGWEVEDITGDSGGDSDSIRIRCRMGEETIAVFIHPSDDGRVEILIF
jgi:hypothetical protein